MTTPYQSFPNSFRRDLRAGKLLIGCWASLSNHITTEVLGVAGFDWLLLDGEHSPNDVATFIPQLMALKDSASAPVVRPASNNPVEIKRLLDAGFYNFLVPFVESVDEASRAVAATRYPPEGMRGVSVSQRSNRYGAEPDYFRRINEQITVIVQIESRAGVAAAAEIAKGNGCYSCHGTVGQGGERSGAPKLAPGPYPYEAFRALVRTPREAMPRFDERFVSEADLQAIHRYLSSLPKGPAAKDIALLR